MSYTPMQLAEAFIKAGELQDALEALDEHIASQPDDADAYRLRSQVHLRVGTLEAALQDLQSVEQTPEDYIFLSVIHERMGDIGAAHASARAACDLGTSEPTKSRALERLLDVMRKNGQIEDALKIALENDWVQWAADAAVDLHDDEQAIGYYTAALTRIEKLFDLTSDNIAANIKARVLLKRGGAFQRLKQWQQAQADYTAASKTIPDDPIIPFNIAVIAAQQGNTEAALEQIREVFSTAPKALCAVMADDLRKNYPDLWSQVAGGFSNDA